VGEVSAPVDVLAVMEQLVALAQDDVLSEPRNPDSSEYDEWERACLVAANARAARDAVRELIEAAKAMADDYYERFRRFESGDALFGPLDEQAAALRAALAKVGAP
jgi:hypothetical protein